MSPTVSVIMPAYNAARFIGRAIDSVLAQTYADFELIVVDDGSTDDTAAIARRYTDPRVRLVQQANAERSAARNHGLRHALGRFIAFLDADDIFLPNKLADQAAALETDSTLGLVAGGNVYLDDAGAVTGAARPWEWAPTLDLERWLTASPVWLPHILVRREWLGRVGGFDAMMTHGEDYDLLLRLAYAGCRMGWVRVPVYGYRLHADQSVHAAVKMIDGHFHALEKLFAQPDVPPALTARQGSIVNAHRLKAVVRAFDAATAAAADPMYVLGRRHLTNYLSAAATPPDRAWARDLGRSVVHPMWHSAPLDLLRAIWAAAPAGSPLTPALFAAAAAAAAREQFFLAWRDNDRGQMGWAFGRVLRYDWRLIDRGMLAIMVRGRRPIR